MTTLAHMWTAFVATLPIWAFVALLVTYCIATERTCRAYKRGQRYTEVRAGYEAERIATPALCTARWDNALCQRAEGHAGNHAMTTSRGRVITWAASHTPEVSADEIPGYLRLLRAVDDEDGVA